MGWRGDRQLSICCALIHGSGTYCAGSVFHGRSDATCQSD